MNNIQPEHIRQELTKAGQSPDAFVGFVENGAKFNLDGKEVEVTVDHERIADTNPDWERPIATARALVKAAVDGDKTFARKDKEKTTSKKAATGTVNNDGAGASVTAQPRGANTPKA